MTDVFFLFGVDGVADATVVQHGQKFIEHIGHGQRHVWRVSHAFLPFASILKILAVLEVDRLVDLDQGNVPVRGLQIERRNVRQVHVLDLADVNQLLNQVRHGLKQVGHEERAIRFDAGEAQGLSQVKGHLIYSSN